MELASNYHVKNVRRKKEAGEDTESFLIETNEASRKKFSLPLTANSHDIILEVDGGD